MPLTFSEEFDIPPVPVSPSQAARQAVVIARKIDAAGGVAAARTAAVAVILAATADDEPSEIRRLRLLYQRAYSEAELEGMVGRTFSSLELG